MPARPRGPCPGLPPRPTLVKEGQRPLLLRAGRRVPGVVLGHRRHTPPRASLEPGPSLPAWVAAVRLSWQHSLPHQAEAEPNSGPKLWVLKHPSEPRRPQRANSPWWKPPGPSQVTGNCEVMPCSCCRVLTLAQISHTHTHTHSSHSPGRMRCRVSSRQRRAAVWRRPSEPLRRPRRTLSPAPCWSGGAWGLGD